MSTFSSYSGRLVRASGYLLRYTMSLKRIPFNGVTTGLPITTRTLCAESETSTRIEDEESPSFEALHSSLTETLSTGNYAKATHVNMLFHTCQSLQQLEKAKEVLASFRKSPSHYRNSIPKAVFVACLRLGVHQQALDMMLDPVKYGLFPLNHAIRDFLQYCTDKEDIEGIQKIIKLMEQAEMERDWTGRAYYLLAKVSLKKVLKDKGRVFEEHKIQRLQNFPSDEVVKKFPRVVLDSTAEDHTQVRAEGTPAEEAATGEGGEEEAATGEGGTEETVKDKEQELTLGDVEAILDLSKTAYSLSKSHGKKVFYSVNGLLLSAGEQTLASQVLARLQTEGFLPESLLLNLKLDLTWQSHDHAGTLALLQEMSQRGMTLNPWRGQKMEKFLLSCDDQSIQQSFLDLKWNPHMYPRLPDYSPDPNK